MCIAGLRRRRDLLGLLLDHRPLGDAEPAEGALLAVIADARLPARLFETLANLLELHAAGVADLDLHLYLPLGELRPDDAHGGTGRGVHRAPLVDDPRLLVLVLEGQELVVDGEKARENRHLGVGEILLAVELHKFAGVHEGSEEAIGRETELVTGTMIARELRPLFIGHFLQIGLRELARAAGEPVEGNFGQRVLEHRLAGYQSDGNDGNGIPAASSHLPRRRLAGVESGDIASGLAGRLGRLGHVATSVDVRTEYPHTRMACGLLKSRLALH